MAQAVPVTRLKLFPTSSTIPTAYFQCSTTLCTPARLRCLRSPRVLEMYCRGDIAGQQELSHRLLSEVGHLDLEVPGSLSAGSFDLGWSSARDFIGLRWAQPQKAV